MWAKADISKAETSSGGSWTHPDLLQCQIPCPIFPHVSAGLAASSSVISPILSPVSTKLKSSTSAVNKPQEGENDQHFLCHHCHPVRGFNQAVWFRARRSECVQPDVKCTDSFKLFIDRITFVIIKSSSLSTEKKKKTFNDYLEHQKIKRTKICELKWDWNFSFIEIEAQPNMESDKKLDKLETFLGRLNSKGAYFSADFKIAQSYSHEAQSYSMFICCKPLKNCKQIICFAFNLLCCSSVHFNFVYFNGHVFLLQIISLIVSLGPNLFSCLCWLISGRAAGNDHNSHWKGSEGSDETGWWNLLQVLQACHRIPSHAHQDWDQWGFWCHFWIPGS